MSQYQLHPFSLELGMKLIHQGCKIYAYISTSDEGGDSIWELRHLGETEVMIWYRRK